MSIECVFGVLKRRLTVLTVLTVLLAVAIVLALMIGGAQPVAVGLVPSPWDKLVHAVVFAVLAVSVGLASGRGGRRVLVVAFAGALLVGALDEWHQVFLPGRSAGLDDLLADAVGAAIGALAARALVDAGRVGCA